MTLQIKGLQIAGMPAAIDHERGAIRLRNALRDVTHVSNLLLAERCEVSTQCAEQIIDALVNEGYLNATPEKEYHLVAPYRPPEKPRNGYVSWYKLTDKGQKLALASAVNKMPRVEAESILAGLLKRVEEVNATAEYLHTVRSVVVYGSFVRGAEFLSDVDIAVELERKEHDPDKYATWHIQRISAGLEKGRFFPHITCEVEWPEEEIFLHLKARTRGLSLHPMDDFLLMRKDEDFAYKVLLGDATDSIASFCSLLRARFYRFRIFRKLSLVGKSKWTSAGELSLVASKVKESKGEHAR